MTAIPEFPNFEALDFRHAKELKSALELSQPEVSELSMGFIFGYSPCFNFRVARLDGNICIFGEIKGMPVMLMPVGTSNLRHTAVKCLNFLLKKFGRAKLTGLPADMAKKWQDEPGWRIVDNRDDYDYLYRVKELVDLAGKDFHAKKNLVAQFRKKYVFRYLNLTPDLLKECLRLQEEWCNLKNCSGDETLAMENTMVRELLKHFGCLDLFGAVILIDGKIRAFTVGERLNRNTAVIHIEKADTEYRGIYQAINNLFCENSLSGYEFVNREQDDGKCGLRKAKLSYHPVRFIVKYNIEEWKAGTGIKIGDNT